MQGFLNLNKPVGLTSHDCVGAIRRLLQLKKVGHGGTLDPAASGVLPIAIGRATRLLPYLSEQKGYQALVRFGLTTTTDDLDGEVVSQSTSASALTLADVQAQLPQFQGMIRQIPPAYSAIQVAGKRLYQLARKGLPVAVPERLVMIESIQILNWQPGPYPDLTLAITCGPGTYIRSIARDLGKQLGTGATLAGLVRTHSGGFDLIDSLTLAQVKHQLAGQQLDLTPPDQVLAHLPEIALEADLACRWQQGQKPAYPADQLPLEVPHRILNQQGEFLGIGHLRQTAAGAELRASMVYKIPV